MNRKSLLAGRPRVAHAHKMAGVPPRSLRPRFEMLEARDMLSADDLLIGQYDGGGVLRYNESAQAPTQGAIAAGDNGLTNVSSVAAAPDGTIYVSSFSTGQVFHYSNAGNYLGVLDTSPVEAPGSLAFGPNGDLYVADIATGSVYWFNTSSGTLGGSVAIPVGSTGYSVPGGIAFANNGDLIVGNLADGSVWEFDSSGNSTNLIAPGTAVGPNDSGDTDDAFLEPASILVEPDGNLLIADLNYTGDNYHHQVVLYNATSGATSQFINLTTPEGTDGGPGADDLGDYAQPESLLLDQDGNLLVGVSPDHNGNGAVQEYNINTGALITTVASGIGTPAGLAYVPAVQTDLLVGDYDNSDVLRYNATSYAAVPGGVAAGVGGLTNTAGVAVAPDGTYYVSSLDTDQILHFNSGGVFLGAFDTDFGMDGDVEAPGSLAFGPNGDLYVADLGGSSVYWFNTSTDALDGSVTLAPDAYGIPGTPGGIAFAYNGDLIVGNIADGSVVQFDSNGNATYLIQPLTTVGNDPTPSEDQFPVAYIQPSSIVVEPDGNLLIADENFDSTNYHHQIVLYNATTGAVSQFINLTTPEGTDGPGGDDLGDYAQPESMMLSTDGNLLVEVSPDHNGNGAVQEYSLNTVDPNAPPMATVISGLGTPAGLAYIRSSPVVTTTNGDSSYTAGASAVAIDTGVTLSDANTVPDLSATVTISGGYQTGDSLNFANTAYITGAVSMVDGVYTLSLTGGDSVADYQAALQSVTFSSTSTSTASRTISFTVTDGTAIGAPATKQIDVFAPAQITGVWVDGSAWNSTFTTYLANNSLGSATYGYELQTGAAQLTDLPWTNINTIYVQFSEGVTVTQNSLYFAGSLTSPVVSTFARVGTTNVYEWTFSTSLTLNAFLLEVYGAGTNAVTDSRGAPLSGDWTTGSSTFTTGSGNGLAGGSFDFDFDVLPADVNQNGFVQTSDVAVLKTLINKTPGTTGYTAYEDLNGDGFINTADIALIKTRINGALMGQSAPSPNVIVEDDSQSGADSLMSFAPAASGSSAQDDAVGTDDVVTNVVSTNAVSPSVAPPIATLTIAASTGAVSAAPAVAASAPAVVVAAPVASSGSSTSSASAPLVSIAATPSAVTTALSGSPLSSIASDDTTAPAPSLAVSSDASQDSRNQAVDSVLADLDLTDLSV